MSKRRTIQQFSVDELHDHPLQATMFDDRDEDFEALVVDMDQNGMRDPLVLLPDRTVLAGHRRLRAARRLSWAKVDGIVRDDLADDPKAAEAFFVMENLNRRQLTPLAKVRCCARLVEIEHGVCVDDLPWSQIETVKTTMAQRVGMSLRNLNRYLCVCRAPRDIQTAVELDYLKITDAGRAAALSKEDQQQLADALGAIYADGATTHEQRKSLVLATVKTALRANIAKKRPVRKTVRKLHKALKEIASELPYLDFNDALISRDVLLGLRPNIEAVRKVLSILHEAGEAKAA